jgi:hypothetical protein
MKSVMIHGKNTFSQNTGCYIIFRGDSIRFPDCHARIFYQLNLVHVLIRKTYDVREADG